MGWPQILIIVLFAMDLGYVIAKHGQAEEGEHDAWATFIVYAILFSILIVGGFFSGG